MPPQVSLRVFREYQGLTLKELAEAITEQGVSITADGLNNAELGRKPISEQLLVAWARALGTKRTHIRTGPELTEWMSAIRADRELARSAA